MYCPCCKSDVAAKLDQDDRTLLCTHCGTQIQPGGIVTSVNDATREAQSLLQRWADPQIFDAPKEKHVSPEMEHEEQDQLEVVELSEIEPIIKKETTNDQIEKELAEADLKNHAVVSKSNWESDPVEIFEPIEETVNRIIDQPDYEAPRSYVVERSDMQILNRPILTTTAFEVQQSINERHSSRFNWRRFLGQSLAYLGTGVLSIGGAGVVWSFYGGPEHVVPTGWVMIFVGQLMLFVGMITLITSGVKELRSDVVNRVDFIRSLLSRLDPPAQLPEKPQFQSRRESKVDSAHKSDVVEPQSRD